MSNVDKYRDEIHGLATGWARNEHAKKMIGYDIADLLERALAEQQKGIADLFEKDPDAVADILNYGKEQS